MSIFCPPPGRPTINGHHPHVISERENFGVDQSRISPIEYRLRDHQCRLRHHQCGCRDGNRYEKGGFENSGHYLADKAINYSLTENNINNSSKVLINQVKQIMN